MITHQLKFIMKSLHEARRYTVTSSALTHIENAILFLNKAMLKSDALEKVSEDILKNYKICSQNSHNSSTIEHKYLEALRKEICDERS